MFDTLYNAETDRYHVRFHGSDQSDLALFYRFIYDLPADQHFFENNGYWITKETYEQLILAQTALKLTPYNYQEEAIQFAVKNLSSLMLLPCGAGKSFVMIAAYAEAVKQKVVRTPGLIIVKASLKYQWQKEVEKFSHFKPHIIETRSQLCGSELAKLKKAKTAEEKALIEAAIQAKFTRQFEQVDLLIANYETLTDDWVRQQLHQMAIQFIAIDEIQFVKNYKAKRSQALAEFKTAKIKIGASATPLQKDYTDAYGIFSILVPTLYKSFSAFAARHIRYGGFGKIIGFKNTDALMLKIKPYLFLKTEEDIASQMPVLMPPIQLWCHLDPKVAEMCATIFEELTVLKEKEKALCASFRSQEEYENSTERQQLEGQILALQTFNQELANAPELLTLSDSQMAKRYAIEGKYSNPKLDLLVEKASEIIEAGERVVIFSRFERMQPIIADRLTKAFKDLKIAKVHGGLSGEERYYQSKVLFKEDPACQVLLASNAMAEGISLSWCKYLIEYDLAESYAIQTQRHGRIRRADSIHQILYVYQILAHDCWDEIALKIVARKELIDAELKN